MVVLVRDHEPVHAVHDDAGRPVELPLPRALGAELAVEAAVPVEDADAVVAAVGHHDQALGCAADTPGPAQVTVPAPLLAELQHWAAEKHLFDCHEKYLFVKNICKPEKYLPAHAVVVSPRLHQALEGAVLNVAAVQRHLQLVLANVI